MSIKRRVPSLLGLVLPFAAALALAAPAHAQTGNAAGTTHGKSHHSSTHKAHSTHSAQGHKKSSTSG